MDRCELLGYGVAGLGRSVGCLNPCLERKLDSDERKVFAKDASDEKHMKNLTSGRNFFARSLA